MLGRQLKSNFVACIYYIFQYNASAVKHMRVKSQNAIWLSASNILILMLHVTNMLKQTDSFFLLHISHIPMNTYHAYIL